MLGCSSPTWTKVKGEHHYTSGDYTLLVFLNEEEDGYEWMATHNGKFIGKSLDEAKSLSDVKYEAVEFLNSL